jgi:tRNA A-37 threonylcarbamoyl transferase component Bud32
MKTPTNKAANSQVKNIPNNNAGQPNSKLYFSIKPLIDKKKSSLNDKENVRYQVIDKKPVKFEEKEEERSSRYSVRRAYDNGILANPKLQAAKHEKIEEGSQANPFLLENCRSYRILHPQTKQPTNRDSSFTPHAGNRNHSGIRGAKDGLSNFGVLLGYNNQNPALFDKRNNSSNISSKSYEILDALSKKEGDRSPVRKNLEASRNKTHENFNKIIEQSTKVIVPQSANFFYDDLKGDRHAPPSSFPRTPHSPNESYLFKNALDRSLLSRVNQGSPISSIVRTKTMDKSGHSALNRSDVSTKTKNSNGNNSFLTKRGEDNDLSRVICHNQDSAMRGGMSKTWVKSGLMDSREEISTISKAPMLTLENPRMPTNQRSNTIDRLAVDSTEKSVQKKKLYNEIENMFSKECHQSSKDSSASHSKAREYELQKCIGQGAYAKVYKAIHLPTKTKVAIKLYEKSKLSEKLRQKSIKREIKILSRLNHPNIVNFIDCFSTKNHIYLVMELVRGLSLYELLKKQPDRKIKESNGKTIIKQILKAMSYCHSKCVSHRDIKLENVIISGNGEVKVIDFGFSTCIPNEKKVKMFCGTPSYMAPEIVQKIEYCGPPVDIWATGVLFYVLISGKFPFRGRFKF